MRSGLFRQVREACQQVATQAMHVHIKHERIPVYAASLPLDTIRRPEHDPASHYLGHGDDTVAFFLTLDAINFGSGYFPHLRKRPGMSGYFTIASSLNERFQESGPFPASELAQLTLQDCMGIFGQDRSNVAIAELMQLFANALNDLGRYLAQHFEGSYIGLVESANRSAERLAALLSEMPYFHDVSAYGDRQVPFYKRAQITPADLSIAFAGQAWGRFDDLDRLTIFADNLVPHVLRVDGILQYEDPLLQRIEREDLVASGSAEEVEIRACSVHAVELLSAELYRTGQKVPPMKLDYLLWNRGQKPQYKAQPRHRTRTVFY